MKRTRTIATTIVAAALVAGPVAVSTQASAAQPATQAVSVSANPSDVNALRDAVVKRANWALATKQWDFKVGSSTYKSSISADKLRNHLEHNGSNANRVPFNKFNGDEWCGYFAAWAWTNILAPTSSQRGRVPAAYPASQAWADGTGAAFKKFTAGSTARPQAGDAVVWRNHDASTGGHVGIVVKVVGNKIYTIEGNVNGDEIAYKYYPWDAAEGLKLNGKTFRGFTSLAG